MFMFIETMPEIHSCWMSMLVVLVEASARFSCELQEGEEFPSLLQFGYGKRSGEVGRAEGGQSRSAKFLWKG